MIETQRQLLPGSHDIEVVRAAPTGHVRAALFDFDGTVSLIRAGWQDVMIPYFVEVLAATPQAEGIETLAAVARDFVDELTGKQTIYQAMRLAEEVTRRGGAAEEPIFYKRRYMELLWEHIHERFDDLVAGRTDPDTLRVPGTMAILTGLRARGVTCYLASGTDVDCVRRECAALELTDCFDGGIGGALDDYKQFSKAMVIERILADHDLHGPELVGFGDGFVEIENTVAAGGIAVGVATDELHGAGVDAWKRNRLIGAGAHLIVPDFGEHERLLAHLFGES
jgi:phosphoglycolate phosphatase-like HAD superfamily hydrolase